LLVAQYPPMLPARTLTIASALAVVLATDPAAADIVNTPECKRNLAAANQQVGAIRAREKRFVPGDLATNCKLLKQNLADMLKARGPIDRCLTGPEHNETIAQLDASIDDMRAVLGDKCAK
jgi:hypothetical protein